MKLFEIISKHNSKHLLKLENKKGVNELYQIIFKNKNNIIHRRYLVIINKKTKEVLKYEQVNNKNIKEELNYFNKLLKNNLKEIKKENKQTNDFVSFDKIIPKYNYVDDYRSDKELKDYSFLLITSSFLLDYLFSHKILDKNTQKILRKVDNDENLILEIQQYMLRVLKNTNKDLKKLKQFSDNEVLDKVFKKYGFDIEHYQIMLGLYLLELWRYNVKNKTIKIHYNYRKVEKLIEKLESELNTGDFEKWRENSQKLAYDIFQTLYNDRPMTKQEAKEFFEKMKNKGDRNA